MCNSRKILKLVVVTIVPPNIPPILPLTRFPKMAALNRCQSPLGDSDSERGEIVLAYVMWTGNRMRWGNWDNGLRKHILVWGQPRCSVTPHTSPASPDPPVTSNVVTQHRWPWGSLQGCLFWLCLRLLGVWISNTAAGLEPDITGSLGIVLCH